VSAVRVVGSSKPETLAAANPHVTVEAEYGDVCVPGSLLTMAHHGPRAGGKCPAAYTAADVRQAFVAEVHAYDGTDAMIAVDNTPSELVVGVSHVDLDTLGGVLAAAEAAGWLQKPTGPVAAAFWALAEWVDLNGPHRIEAGRPAARRAASMAGPDRGDAPVERVVDEAFDAIRAFWAWSQANRGPRFGAELTDVTDWVRAASTMFDDLFSTNRRYALLEAGRAFAKAEAALRERSLVERRGAIVLRSAPTFINHLYDDAPGAAVVGFNETTGAVTVSFADGAASPISAIELVQALWGPLAGGHHGIAGSPRVDRLTLDDARVAFEAVCRRALVAVCGACGLRLGGAGLPAYDCGCGADIYEVTA